jgi:hypothetical protein
MKNIFDIQLNWKILIITLLAYMFAMSMFFEYCVNREINEYVGGAAGVIALIYTVWQIEFINKTIKNKVK